MSASACSDGGTTWRQWLEDADAVRKTPLIVSEVAEEGLYQLKFTAYLAPFQVTQRAKSLAIMSC